MKPDPALLRAGLCGLGLASPQIDAYLGLMQTGPSSLTEFARTDAGAGVAAATVEELMAIGLVVADEGTPPVLRCTPPDVALERLASAAELRIVEARTVIPVLSEQFAATQVSLAQDSVQLVTGDYETLSRQAGHLLTATRARLRVMSRRVPEPAFKPTDISDQLVTTRLVHLCERGVGYQALFSREDFPDLDFLRECMQPYRDAGGEIRLAPTLPVRYFLYDDHLAQVVATRGEMVEGVFLVRASPLLNVLQAFFDQAWAAADPLYPADLGDGLAHLIEALRDGASDHAICRRLGWSRSTLHRRLRDLMSEHGVSTRFQLGMRIGSSERS